MYTLVTYLKHKNYKSWKTVNLREKQWVYKKNNGPPTRKTMGKYEKNNGPVLVEYIPLNPSPYYYNNIN